MKTYTFHVSLPGFGRVWRKLELTADSTLEDLHFAIQDAYEFGADHLYSFFMSGEAWDDSTEYTLPEGADPWDAFDDEEDEGDEDEAAEDEGDEDGADDTVLAEDAPADAAPGTWKEPTAQDLLDTVNLLRSDPALRAKATEYLTQQFGVPEFMMDLVLQNAETLLQSPDGKSAAGLFDLGLGLDGETAGDVRETILDSLSLTVGQTFLYLFDYGDEWRFKVRVHAINQNADPAVAYPRLVQSVGAAPEQYPDWDEEETDEEDEDFELT